MTTTLITGANKGLGFETARQLIAAGHKVYIGSRDLERGERAAAKLGARVVQLDVTSEASVRAAAAKIASEGGLDVLINNAGISLEIGATDVLGPRDTTAAIMEETFATNVIGVVRVLHAFVPLLLRSTAPVVVNVSSDLGSLTALSTPDHPPVDGLTAFKYPGVAYPASKAALNMVTVQYAKAFPNMRVNSVEPGMTQTDIAGGLPGLQPVSEGAEIIVRMAQIASDGPTGTYVDKHGALPW